MKIQLASFPLKIGRHGTLGLHFHKSINQLGLGSGYPLQTGRYSPLVTQCVNMPLTPAGC